MLTEFNLPKKKRLTIKEKKFAKDVSQTGNATKSVKKFYNPSSDNSARAMGHNLMSREHVKAEIEKHMLSLEPVASSWLEAALRAPIGRGVDEDGNIAMSWEDKRKWIETGAKLGGWGKQPEPSSIDVTPGKIKRPS